MSVDLPDPEGPMIGGEPALPDVDGHAAQGGDLRVARAVHLRQTLPCVLRRARKWPPSGAGWWCSRRIPSGARSCPPLSGASPPR